MPCDAPAILLLVTTRRHTAEATELCLRRHGFLSRRHVLKRKLTNLVIEKIAPPPSGRLDVFDEYLPGFALRVTPNGHRSYVARARIKGQSAPITVTIGNTRDITLDDARQRAAEMLRQMRAGADPRPEKIERAAVLTFDQLIDEWAT